MNNKKLFVFFGATGNLFSEKIFPAFYHLIRRNKIDPFHIIAIGRRFSDESSYRLFLSQLIEKKIPDMNFSILNQLFQNTSYYRGDIDEPQTFSSFTSKFPLQNYREIIFYLSTIPSLYAQTIQLIHNLTSQILAPIPIKIVVEKPFGFDKNSFKELNRLLNAFISEKNIFYVDHYLGKDTVQNIIILKAENLFIEKLLSAQYVKEIRFIVSEKDGVGSRGKFYEETGAIRDVLQNHILQLISLIAMDIPSLCQDDKKECSFFIEMMQQKKISVIKHLELPPAQQIILGQYQSYKQEIPHSTNQTETLIRIPLYITNQRWSRVPFWVVTGKKLANKISYIEIIFRSTTSKENRMIIEIQPEEKIDLFIQAKIPGEGLTSSSVCLNFNSLGTFGINSPEAYENILVDCYWGDKTLFPDSQFILHSWTIVDKLRELISANKILPRKYEDNQYNAEDFLKPSNASIR